DIIMGRNNGPLCSLSILAITILLIYIGTLQGKRQVIASNLNTALPTAFYIRYFMLRIPFLVSYEIFFRGLLLFLVAEKMGITIAILTDITLNIVLHFFSSKKMMWVYIPFSMLCCMLNYQARAVWPSIVLHLAISFSFELTIVKKLFNPIKISS
ncbi:MAG TPA: CPBP family intramembrane glutamic endopeptidase, partial [Ferruginibacter sp.]|nr:CPBP family intramembrane glutamic endopeptidase [Ferruginibacter sp.]